MKIKTNELTGAALDWLVAKCEDTLLDSTLYQYSTDWAWGGPIIEREGIDLTRISGALWDATIRGEWTEDGHTPLVAAMRCYVGSVIGNEVEVPDELAEVAV
jgi:hypothetical protein